MVKKKENSKKSWGLTIFIIILVILIIGYSTNWFGLNKEVRMSPLEDLARWVFPGDNEEEGIINPVLPTNELRDNQASLANGIRPIEDVNMVSLIPGGALSQALVVSGCVMCKEFGSKEGGYTLNDDDEIEAMDDAIEAAEEQGKSIGGYTTDDNFKYGGIAGPEDCFGDCETPQQECQMVLRIPSEGDVKITCLCAPPDNKGNIVNVNGNNYFILEDGGTKITEVKVNPPKGKCGGSTKVIVGSISTSEGYNVDKDEQNNNLKEQTKAKNIVKSRLQQLCQEEVDGIKDCPTASKEFCSNQIKPPVKSCTATLNNNLKCGASPSYVVGQPRGVVTGTLSPTGEAVCTCAP
ncbi:MAG: hypothetical protein NUV97_01105 [archaeon]|nr:hypothetical protein [archaeon]MCR4323440.1 hypothetical protein [Nanoarchaeota archaeon]